MLSAGTQKWILFSDAILVVSKLTVKGKNLKFNLLKQVTDFTQYRYLAINSKLQSLPEYPEIFRLNCNHAFG